MSALDPPSYHVLPDDEQKYAASASSSSSATDARRGESRYGRGVAQSPSKSSSRSRYVLCAIDFVALGLSGFFVAAVFVAEIAPSPPFNPHKPRFQPGPTEPSQNSDSLSNFDAETQTLTRCCPEESTRGSIVSYTLFVFAIGQFRFFSRSLFVAFVRRILLLY